MKNFISLDDAFASVNEQNTHFIDGTYRGAGRAGFDQARIGNAIYFDIDEIANHESHMAHTMPSADEFSTHMSRLGVNHDDNLIIYAQDNMAMAATRVWYMFKYFGHAGDVKILDGSLKQWLAAGHEINSSSPLSKTETIYNCHTNKDKSIKRSVRSYEDILTIQNRTSDQILDVRSESAYSVEHIPNSQNLFFMNLFNDQGSLKPFTDIKEMVKGAIDTTKPTTVSCGSGVTACLLLAVLDEMGFEDIALYDGSWSDYSNHRDAPISKSKMRFF